MIETLLLSVAMTLGPVSIPEITWVSAFEDVRPVLDAHGEANHRFPPTGLSVLSGNTCIIYATKDDTFPEWTKRVYYHEWLHCIGMNHEQIEIINERLGLNL
jgi:hypothetical protein